MKLQMNEKKFLIITSTMHHLRIVGSSNIKDPIDLVTNYELKEEIKKRYYFNLSNIFFLRSDKTNDSFLIRKFFQVINLIKIVLLIKRHRYKAIGICSPYNFLSRTLINFVSVLNKKTCIHFFEDGLGFYSKSGETSPDAETQDTFFKDYSDYIKKTFYLSKNKNIIVHSYFHNENLLNLPIECKLIDRAKFNQILDDEYKRKKNIMLDYFREFSLLNLDCKKNIIVFCPNPQIENYDGYKNVLNILGSKKLNSILCIKKIASNNGEDSIAHAINLPSEFSLELYSYFFDEYFPNNNVYFVSTISTFYYTNNAKRNSIIDVSYIKGNQELCDLLKFNFFDSSKIIYLDSADDLHTYYN